MTRDLSDRQDYENGKKMKKQELISTVADCRELSIKRLPSGFGSVRYLGKGRCHPYAVHPPEKSVKTAQSGNRRLPALCYVRSRETGIKILMIYHAGLYAPGLENDPCLLNQLYKEVIGQEVWTEINKGVLISWKGLPRIIMPPSGSHITPAENNRLLEETGGLTENADSHLTDAGKFTADTYSHRAGAGRFTADAFSPRIDAGRFKSDADSRPAGAFSPRAADSHFAAKTDNPQADTGRFLAATESAWLQNAENTGAGEKKLQHKLETGQAESVEDLYGRLYSLQAYIKNLMEDISRMRTNHSDIPQDVSGPSCPLTPIHADRVPTIYAGDAAFHRPDSVPGFNAADAAFHRPDSVPGFYAADAAYHRPDDTAPTLSTVYTAFHRFKYGPQAARQLSKSSRNVTAAAYRKLARFYDRSLDEINVMEWQELINETAASGHSRSAVTDLVTLIRQLYRFALPRDMCTRDYGNYIVMPYTSEESHHQDFTDAELKILWQHKDDPVAAMILIMCYSGFRVGAFETLQVILDQDRRNGYFCGGLKTKAGKNRIVPVHSAIMPLLRRIMDSNGQPVFFCGKSSRRFREIMKQTLVRLGIDTVQGSESEETLPGIKESAFGKSAGIPEKNGNTTDNSRTAPAADGILPGSPPASGIYRKPHGEYRYHTPHSSRHTFSRLCESYGVNDADRRRMLGHSFGNDITNGVYGHRSVEELRAQIEKIKLPQ